MDHIDAIVTTEDGHSYVFAGEYYWDVDEVRNTGDGHAHKIADDWVEGLTDIESAFGYLDGNSYFLKV